MTGSICDPRQAEYSKTFLLIYLLQHYMSNYIPLVEQVIYYLLVTSQCWLCMFTLWMACLTVGKLPFFQCDHLLPCLTSVWRTRRVMVQWVFIFFCSLLSQRKESWTCSSGALKISCWILSPSWGPGWNVNGVDFRLKMGKFEPVIFTSQNASCGRWGCREDFSQSTQQPWEMSLQISRGNI